ncbi:ABC transporter permease [Streptomyces sp. CA-106131]|uniref:ABC transporter permease n=1 Tax=Streptomyces sp. CA-106131 TaxID=3240045 RepID=UPI003D8CE0F1
MSTSVVINGAILLTVIVAVVIAVLVTPNFLSVDNLRAILRNASLVGLVAVAMTPITLSGNFFSLGTQQGAMAASVGFVVLVGRGMDSLLAVLVILFGLLVVGVVQGLVISAGLNPVITTLAVGAILYGIISLATNGGIVSVGSHHVSWGSSTIVGVPLEVLVFVLFTTTLGVVMSKTVIGREMMLAGSNKNTAEVSGISYRRVTVVAFAIFSIGLAIVGALYGAGFGQATDQSFGTLTFDVIAAILVGGTAIEGGFGSPLRSALGAVFIAVISDTMQLNNLSTGGQLAVEGAVVVAVMLLLKIIRRRVEVR